MDTERPCPLAVDLASHMREARTQLTEQWLESIAARVPHSPDRSSTAGELRDHVPHLIDDIADFLEHPADEITADVPVVAKAIELAALRLDQGSDAGEVLNEFEMLGGVLHAFTAGVATASPPTGSPEDLLTCSQRIFRAIAVIEQVTTAYCMRVLVERVAEREERLRRFGRMITHELKNRVGATLGAGQLLREEWLGAEERERFGCMVEENARAIRDVLENLSALSKIDGGRRGERNVALREVVSEVFHRLRGLARGREVELRVTGELPEIEVNAAAVDMCLSNYLSNAIRYSDPSATQRWAEVGATVEEPSDGAGGAELTVRVRDNGLGVPPAARDRLFERFFRAHSDVVSTEGTGLGLSLVQETADSLGGRAWAEFADDDGSVFAFSLPLHRDAAHAGRRNVSGSAGAVMRPDDRRTGAAPVKASD